MKFLTKLLFHAADTRTNQHVTLGLALLQHQHIGILSGDLHNATNETSSTSPIPLLPPHSTCMPSPWVRGALIVRANSLIRGHSGVRWRLLESMIDLLNKDVIPVRAHHHS